MVIQSGSLHQPVSQQSCHCHRAEQGTLQQQRWRLLISVNQISAAVWLFVACCQSLSQTQQLIFLSTAVMAGVETRKRGRPTDTVQNSSIKQPHFASVVEVSQLFEGSMKKQSWDEFQKGVDTLVNNSQLNKSLPDNKTKLYKQKKRRHKSGGDSTSKVRI